MTPTVAQCISRRRRCCASRRWAWACSCSPSSSCWLTEPQTPERARLSASSPGQHTFRQFTSTAAFGAGAREGIRVANGSMTISKPGGTKSFAGKRWSWSRWTSGWVQPGHAFTQLVPTWNAITPANTWVQVQARVRSSTGRVSGWKVMASWSTRDAGFRRTSGASQRDSVAGVSTDTLTASPGSA